MSDRQYDDPCGIARALNLIGERWALLVVRELLFGPKRFTDLRAGMPAASQNVLSHRLQELEQSDIVSRRKTGPRMYELTQRGYGLRPVVLELAKWGCHMPTASSADLSVAALIFAMLTTFSPSHAADMRATYQLRVDEDSFRASVADGQVDIAHGTVENPDAVIETDRVTLRNLVFAGARLPDAINAGTALVQGDEQLAARFMSVFPRPTVSTA